MATNQSLNASSGTAPDGETDSPPAQLTAKETQTLMWCFKGKTSWEIARIQNCSEATINFHFSNIRRKFAVSSRSAALLKALETGAIRIGQTGVRGAHEPD
ncbi:helix-turn-helix domain-containing protein [Pseudomonas sp. C2B4]|uniref:helix-turn-helix domain-containing protein n=1 Tax=Pseudomonas sp. C2B4 TaxID=2735270 RepID=UPI001586954A|nr:helix-turn-helix domain-containing protein [Pseudomonas sp. C2B4]NUU39438.1 helix-turn-helix domain-containing protein [Pseudomonas sp. C2B4]